jgi:hypothetical protein
VGDEKPRARQLVGSKSRPRSFRMTPGLSYIVIINLIADLSFLYHIAEKPVVTRLD